MAISFEHISILILVHLNHWELFAAKLGVTLEEIRFLDTRTMN